jgi:ABC-type dipeptide/oligopeptide/nickel transport system permease subunit
VPTTPNQPDAITGVQALQGQGVVESRGFWIEAWAKVVRRPGAVLALAWIALVAAAACFAPLVASGHPLLMRELDADGAVVATTSPLLRHLAAADVLLILVGALGPVWILLPLRLRRTERLGIALMVAFQAGLTLGIARGAQAWFVRPTVSDAVRAIEQREAFPLVVSALAALAGALVCLPVPAVRRLVPRLATALGVAAAAATISVATWSPPPEAFTYTQREAAGEIEAVYTLVPWSPTQRFGDRDTKELRPGGTSALGLRTNLTVGIPPGELDAPAFDNLRARVARAPLSEANRAALDATLDDLAARSPPATLADARGAVEARLAAMERAYPIGTDASGQDVLSQLIHASRLSLSIGFVATGIAVVIGVTIGALMGYFGGFIDLALYRVVEIFMAIPVLVILIVAAALLPRNTYVMMAVIGCFTWHGAARFTRAEFLRLRNQDFVQAARAAGLNLRSILFRHMLPNGVTPVLVDASFGIALAILFEAVISFLGYGPADQPSWGRLLADATGETTRIHWWLATFPGAAIFLTVLAYNLLGEALRDAIDPKLRKARA